MTDRSFSIGRAIKFGWKKFKDQPWTWVFSLLFVLLVAVSHSFVVNWALGNGFTWNLGLNWQEFDYSNLQFEEHRKLKGNLIVWSIFSVYVLVKAGLTLGLIRMGIQAADDLPVKMGHLFSRFRYVFNFLIAEFIFWIILSVGLVLFIFPGLIWLSKFSLYPYFIADRGAGPIQALDLSSQATKGAKWDIFGLIFTSFCVLLIGSLMVGIGLFAVVPLLYIAWGVVYRHLSSSMPVEVITSPAIANPDVVNPTNITQQ